MLTDLVSRFDHKFVRYNSLCSSRHDLSHLDMVRRRDYDNRKTEHNRKSKSMSTTSRDVSKELVSFNLRRLLKRAGMTQTDLAKAVYGEVTPNSRVTVHRWVAGKILPTTWQQLQLAKALGAEITELFRPEKKFRKSR